jgi:hypothetical protein
MTDQLRPDYSEIQVRRPTTGPYTRFARFCASPFVPQEARWVPLQSFQQEASHPVRAPLNARLGLTDGCRYSGT